MKKNNFKNKERKQKESSGGLTMGNILDLTHHHSASFEVALEHYLQNYMDPPKTVDYDIGYSRIAFDPFGSSQRKSSRGGRANYHSCAGDPVEVYISCLWIKQTDDAELKSLFRRIARGEFKLDRCRVNPSAIVGFPDFLRSIGFTQFGKRELIWQRPV